MKRTQHSKKFNKKAMMIKKISLIESGAYQNVYLKMVKKCRSLQKFSSHAHTNAISFK